MISIIVIGVISYIFGIMFKKNFYNETSSVNAKQLPVVLIFLITLAIPSMYYGLETLATNRTIFRQLLLQAFFAGFTMYFALFKSKVSKKSHQSINDRVETDEKFMTVTVKDDKPLGNFALSKESKSSLIFYHKLKVPLGTQILFENLDEKEEDDLARRILKELQDEYEKIENKLLLINNALIRITDNDERQVLSRALQRFVEARSNLENLAHDMEIPIYILNGSSGAAHNSTKKIIRKDNLNI